MLALLRLHGCIGWYRGTIRGWLRHWIATICVHTLQVAQAVSSAALLLQARMPIGRSPFLLQRVTGSRLRRLALLAGGCADRVATAALLRGFQQKLPGLICSQEAPARPPDAPRGVVVPRLVQVGLHARAPQSFLPVIHCLTQQLAQACDGKLKWVWVFPSRQEQSQQVGHSTDGAPAASLLAYSRPPPWRAAAAGAGCSGTALRSHTQAPPP